MESQKETIDDKESLISKKVAIPNRGISEDRITNKEEVKIIKELIKCSICSNVLLDPLECDVCGSLFCEECINDRIKTDKTCPNGCKKMKIENIKLNSKKLLSLVRLRCINYPECNVDDEYWKILEHEKQCFYQRINCPNGLCNFAGTFLDLKKHLQGQCSYLNFECGFCKCKVPRNSFESHLEEHYKDKTFIILQCSFCGSTDNLRRCICKKPICFKCLEIGRNVECEKSCYIFQFGNKITTGIYSLSKYPLPRNFEAKIHFFQVDWVRTGISFDSSIDQDQTDVNCPPYDIYCVLEDLVQFYTRSLGWKNCFNKTNKPLRAGDTMTVSLKNGELRFFVNNTDLGSVIKINMSVKKNMYLFIHTRNEKSKAEIVYITELLS